MAEQVAQEMDKKMTIADVDAGKNGAAGQRRTRVETRRERKAKHQWEEKDIVARGELGTVKLFRRQAGYGLITRKSTGDDLFVHRSSIAKFNEEHVLATLDTDEEVKFDVVEIDNERQAVNVTAADGGPVKGQDLAPKKSDDLLPVWALRFVPIDKQPRHYGQRRVITFSTELDMESGEKRRRPKTVFEPRYSDSDIVERGIIGTVKRFVLVKGYGFVGRDVPTGDKERDEDAFVHHTYILKPNPEHIIESLKVEEKVKYDLVKSEKGMEAINVTAADGGNVQGHIYAPAVGARTPHWCIRLVYGFVPSAYRRPRSAPAYDARGARAPRRAREDNGPAGRRRRPSGRRSANGDANNKEDKPRRRARKGERAAMRRRSEASKSESSDESGDKEEAGEQEQATAGGGKQKRASNGGAAQRTDSHKSGSSPAPVRHTECHKEYHNVVRPRETSGANNVKGNKCGDTGAEKKA